MNEWFIFELIFQPYWINLLSCLKPIRKQTGNYLVAKGEKMLNQKGQSLVEYVIISSLIGIVCLIAVKQFGEVIKTRVEWMEKSVVKSIKRQ
jgi:hypothetical protein